MELLNFDPSPSLYSLKKKLLHVCLLRIKSWNRNWILIQAGYLFNKVKQNWNYQFKQEVYSCLKWKLYFLGKGGKAGNPRVYMHTRTQINFFSKFRHTNQFSYYLNTDKQLKTVPCHIFFTMEHELRCKFVCWCESDAEIRRF